MTHRNRYTTVEGDELYRKLAFGESVVLVDVRTDTEFAERHIPGSMLIPLHELELRLDEVPNGSTPIALLCEHGLRSASACKLLAEHGYSPLFNLAGGLHHWPGPVVVGAHTPGTHRHGIVPSSFLVENFDLLEPGLALDVAMGGGRNAIYLATRGFDVDGVDADSDAVARARAAARKLGAPIRAIVGNFADGTYIIPIEMYETIIVFNYLNRPLIKDIKDGVVPGGIAVYQTRTHAPDAPDSAAADHPFRLRPDELREFFADWEVLRYREFTGPSRNSDEPRSIAGIVARKPNRLD